MRGVKKLTAIATTSVLVVGVWALPAFASDHLANAANSPGAEQRGFSNPVAANLSGTLGAAAQPGTLPGEGDPKAGGDRTTPAVDLSFVPIRSGHGDPQAG